MIVTAREAIFSSQREYYPLLPAMPFYNEYFCVIASSTESSELCETEIDNATS